MACNVYYTFLSSYELCNVCLFRYNSLTQFYFEEMSVISFNFCTTLLIVCMRRFKGYLGVSASAARCQSSVLDSVKSFFQHTFKFSWEFPEKLFRAAILQTTCRRPLSSFLVTVLQIVRRQLELKGNFSKFLEELLFEIYQCI